MVRASGSCRRRGRPSAAADPAARRSAEAAWRRISCSSFTVRSIASLARRAELLRRFLERSGADLEADRERARGRQHPRLRRRRAPPAPGRARRPWSTGVSLRMVPTRRSVKTSSRNRALGSTLMSLVVCCSLVAIPGDFTPALPAPPNLVVEEGLLDLLLRVHHERARTPPPARRWAGRSTAAPGKPRALRSKAVSPSPGSNHAASPRPPPSCRRHLFCRPAHRRTRDARQEPPAAYPAAG